MVPVTSLVIPILVASVVVFVASSIIHMVLPYHKSDLRAIPKPQDEAQLLDTFRRLNLATGDYGAPHPRSQAGMQNPEFIAEMKKGPIVFMNIVPGFPPALGVNLMQWFVFVVIVNFFVAYVTGRAVGPGGDYLTVFRFAGTTGFMGYSLGLVPESIWYKRRWSRTLISVFDGLVYGLLVAGVFGWLWPR